MSKPMDKDTVLTTLATDVFGSEAEALSHCYDLLYQVALKLAKKAYPNDDPETVVKESLQYLAEKQLNTGTMEDMAKAFELLNKK